MSDYNFDGPHLLKKRCSIKIDPLYFLLQEMTMYSSIMMLLYLLCRNAALAMDRFDILGALSQLHYKIVPLLIYCILSMKLELNRKVILLTLYIYMLNIPSALPIVYSPGMLCTYKSPFGLWLIMPNLIETPPYTSYDFSKQLATASTL
jgi:hypothetical protein